MKTIDTLKEMIREEESALRQLKSEYKSLCSSNWGGEAVRRCKEIKAIISKRSAEISRLRTIIRYVESASAEGIEMLYAQLARRAERIKASAALLETEQTKKEYLTNAGAAALNKQLKELRFILS